MHGTPWTAESGGAGVAANNRILEGSAPVKRYVVTVPYRMVSSVNAKGGFSLMHKAVRIIISGGREDGNLPPSKTGLQQLVRRDHAGLATDNQCTGR